MSSEPDNAVLRMLRDMRAEFGDMRAEMATKTELASPAGDLRAEMHSLRANVAILQGEDVKTRRNLETRCGGSSST
ncbi:MAG: hypothetical protein KF723_17890 [Rhizobiaceae bacterium]|nr:hypothetical protein [Rhizobiaceae bacterium]